MGRRSRLRGFRLTLPAGSCLPAAGVDKQRALATRQREVALLRCALHNCPTPGTAALGGAVCATMRYPPGFRVLSCMKDAAMPDTAF